MRYGPPTSGIRFDCRQQFRNFSLVIPASFARGLPVSIASFAGYLFRGELTGELLTRQVGAHVPPPVSVCVCLCSVMSGFSYFMCNFNTYYQLTALINARVCVRDSDSVCHLLAIRPSGITCSYSCFGQTLRSNIVLHIHKIQLSWGEWAVCWFLPSAFAKKKTNFQCILEEKTFIVLLHIKTNQFLLHTSEGNEMREEIYA